MGEAKLRDARLRRGLPALPGSMRRLPIDGRGFPVPWFVAWLDQDREVQPGRGVPDFRLIGNDRIRRAVNEQLCWLCGTRLLPPAASVVGPMCAVNRISSEPPSHIECARFAVRACPFLARPHMRRNDKGFEKIGVVPAPGNPIPRNPGVTVVWLSKHVTYVLPQSLFDIGEPLAVEWYAEGRAATRAEVEQSFDTGLVLLEEAAARDENPVASLLELAAMAAQARTLFPLS
jgi:hypothetical protein